MSLGDEVQAFLEKRDSERLSARLQIRFRPIPREEADRILAAGDFTDVFATSNLKEDDQPGDDLQTAFTENISISGLKLVGDLRLVGADAVKEGSFLLVEISVPEAPIPVRTLATVIWTTRPPEGEVQAGLFFVGIHKQDVSKVAKFLVLQRRAKQA